MKRFTLLATLAALLAATTAHAGWWRTFGDEGYDVGNCVQITSDGNYIIAGNKADSLWLLKVDTSGYIIWSKAYPGYGKWVEETPDGGFIVCGSPDLMKVTSEGDSVWAQDYGIQAQCVQVVDGGYAVTGYTGFYGDTSWLIKTDAVGDTLWTRTYQVPEHNRNLIYFLQITDDGGYIMTGETTIENEEFGTGYLWLIKTESLGVVEWTKQYGSGELADFYEGYCVRQTSDSGYIVSGHTPEGSGFWVLKTDENGDTLWTQNYGEGIGFSIHGIDSWYIIVGSTDKVSSQTSSCVAIFGDLWLIKTDIAGDTIWTRMYGGGDHDEGKCVQQTSDGGFIIVGYTWSFGAGYEDIYLLKTDSLGLLTIEEEAEPELARNWDLVSTINSEAVIHYNNHQSGFHVFIFDVLGCKVDELHSTEASGTIRWGKESPPGVYFIQVYVDDSNKTSTDKFVLVR